MDLVTAEAWRGMLGGVHCVCLCVVLCACLECLPPHPVNQKTHTGGEEGGGSVVKMRWEYRRRNDGCWFIHVFTRTLIFPPGSVFKRSMFLRICHLLKQSMNVLVPKSVNKYDVFDLSGQIKPIKPVH